MQLPSPCREDGRPTTVKHYEPPRSYPDPPSLGNEIRPAHAQQTYSDTPIMAWLGNGIRPSPRSSHPPWRGWGMEFAPAHARPRFTTALLLSDAQDPCSRPASDSPCAKKDLPTNASHGNLLSRCTGALQCETSSIALWCEEHNKQWDANKPTGVTLQTQLLPNNTHVSSPLPSDELQHVRVCACVYNHANAMQHSRQFLHCMACGHLWPTRGPLVRWQTNPTPPCLIRLPMARPPCLMRPPMARVLPYNPPACYSFLWHACHA